MREKRMRSCDHRGRDWRCDHKPRNTWSHKKLEEARKGLSPRAFGGSMALPKPQFQTSSLQNCERRLLGKRKHRMLENLKPVQYS